MHQTSSPSSSDSGVEVEGRIVHRQPHTPVPCEGRPGEWATQMSTHNLPPDEREGEMEREMEGEGVKEGGRKREGARRRERY